MPACFLLRLMAEAVRSGLVSRSMVESSETPFRSAAGTMYGRGSMAQNVDGAWSLVQSNGFTVEVDIAQARDPSGNLADGPLHGSAHQIGGGETNLSGALNGDSP
jgi:hypothetical protein